MKGDTVEEKNEGRHKTMQTIKTGGRERREQNGTKKFGSRRFLKGGKIGFPRDKFM